MGNHAEKNGNSKNIILAIIVIVILVIGIYFIINNNKEEESTMTSITGQTEASKGITIEDFKTKIEENGLKVDNTVEKSAELIGATEGVGYEIDGETVEVYKFDENSTDELAKTNIESAKKDGKISMPTFETTLDAKYNKGLCLIGYENHPDSEKILEIFNNL